MSGHWIEHRLEEIGRRKSELAAALQVDRSRVSELVGGRRRLSIAELPLISRFLRMSISDVVFRETGDAGYVPDDLDSEILGESFPGSPTLGITDHSLAEGWDKDTASRTINNSAGRIYSATKDALSAFNRYGLDEMSPSEIDTYAKVIARCATRAEFKDDEARKQHIESKVIELKDFREFGSN